MYVEIGNFQVQEGELLPTKNITDTYVFEWEMSKKDLYSMLMIDLDAPYPEDPVDSPFLHFLMVNITDVNGVTAKEGDIVFEYLPPSPPPDSEPHQYEIYVFKQSCEIHDVWAEGRDHFNLEKWTDCPLQMVEKFTFYGSENIENFEEKAKSNVFNDYYEETLSDEDLLILADVYGIENVTSLSPKEIQYKINQILSYQ